ncbi:MAG TPA: AraC family transcriptional regulator [Bacteroidia bacterium]
MEAIGAKGNFLYSCVHEKKRGVEQFVEEHAFGYLVAGETHFHTPDGTVLCKEGTIGFVKRNQLIKTMKVPPAQGEYKAVNIILDQEFLRRYASEHNIKPSGHYTGNPLLELKPNAFIKGYFDSILPYFDEPEQMTDSLAQLKMTEGLELLLKYSPEARAMLFDFNEPFKIDLEAYMNKNYTYNVALAQFAKLTGRSLATFKRDFQKTFDASPERWLQKKRLEHAHFLISKKKQAPGEAYLDVGFENLSHFSTAFKKFFGYTPSSLAKG